jgi:peptidoglycan biosynthesis protein MviN/MurJ (putative lipid II flippase)
MSDTPTKTGPNLGRASAILASGTTVSRILGFVKAFVLLQTLGSIGLATDAFSIANQLPNTIFVIVAGAFLLLPHIGDDSGEGFLACHRKVAPLPSGLLLLLIRSRVELDSRERREPVCHRNSNPR